MLEHEIAVWNPAQLVSTYRLSYDRFKGSASLTDDASAAYQRDADRRWQEFRDFLGLGRLLVVLLPSPSRFYIATGQTRNDGTAAKPRIVRIVDERTPDELIPVRVELVEASGDGFKLLAGEPFAAFWRAVGEQFHYACYLRNTSGTPLLAIKGTDKPVGSLVEDHGGTILLLPQRYEYSPDIEQNTNESAAKFDERWDREQAKIDRELSGAFVDALLELARELRGSPDEGLPDWASGFALPGEQDAVSAVRDAEDRAGHAWKRAEETRHALLSIQRQKILITGSGRPLENAVEQALTELGCTVEAGEAGRADRIVHWKKRTAVVEIKGVSKSAGEKDAAQLEKWVSEYTVEHSRVPKAILLVNAWRTKPLNERDQPTFPAQMIPYSEGRDQCLATTAQLLSAVALASSVRKKEQFLKALFSTEGVLEGWSWENAVEQLVEVADAESD